MNLLYENYTQYICIDKHKIHCAKATVCQNKRTLKPPSTNVRRGKHNNKQMRLTKLHFVCSQPHVYPNKQINRQWGLFLRITIMNYWKRKMWMPERDDRVTIPTNKQKIRNTEQTNKPFIVSISLLHSIASFLLSLCWSPVSPAVLATSLWGCVPSSFYVFPSLFALQLFSNSCCRAFSGSSVFVCSTVDLPSCIQHMLGLNYSHPTLCHCLFFRWFFSCFFLSLCPFFSFLVNSLSRSSSLFQLCRRDQNVCYKIVFQKSQQSL